MSSLSVGLNLNPGGKSKLNFPISHTHTHTHTLTLTHSHSHTHIGSFTEKPSKSFTQKHTHTQEAILRNPVKALLKNYLRKKTGTERMNAVGLGLLLFLVGKSCSTCLYSTHHSPLIRKAIPTKLLK